MGKVIGIATRTMRKAPMDLHDSVKITFDKGVANDSRGLNQGNRQVTVMSIEDWQLACDELNKNYDWTIRRANFLIEGLNFKNTTGQILKIGSATLEITGELTPCHRMDEQIDGLTKALTPNWRGGVTCKIIAEGNVSKGDKIILTKEIIA